jgi:hypothetical protein
MFDEITAVEEFVTEVLLDSMTERVMSKRGISTKVQASSMRGVKASLSNAQEGTSQASVERRTKHKDDIANRKLVPSILPAYIPPLSSAINRDNVPRDFEYTLVTAYLPKGVRIYRADQDKVTTLKFCDFNLGDLKVYSMLTPYKYLTRTKRKNLKIVPQQWTMNLAESTLLNVMKIPHFGRHQKVNFCVKLLAIYHEGYLWLKHHIYIDPVLINRITGLSMQGPDPQDYYPGKTVDHALS